MANSVTIRLFKIYDAEPCNDSVLLYIVEQIKQQTNLDIVGATWVDTNKIELFLASGADLTYFVLKYDGKDLG